MRRISGEKPVYDAEEMLACSRADRLTWAKDNTSGISKYMNTSTRTSNGSDINADDFEDASAVSNGHVLVRSLDRVLPPSLNTFPNLVFISAGENHADIFNRRKNALESIDIVKPE